MSLIAGLKSSPATAPGYHVQGLARGGRFKTTLYHGLFHAVSAFNNAGFALYSDNLMGFAGDPLILVPISVAIIAGGLGYPVMFELHRELRTPRTWSVLTRITVLMTALLLTAGTLAILTTEWTNSRTLGPMGWPDKVLNGFFQAVVPRTAGFNSIDYAEARDTTLLITDALMFIGGGSASTAGGIKLTTFTVLLFAIVAEVRGDTDIDAFGRRLTTSIVRQCIAIALVAIAIRAPPSSRTTSPRPGRVRTAGGGRSEEAARGLSDLPQAQSRENSRRHPSVCGDRCLPRVGGNMQA